MTHEDYVSEAMKEAEKAVANGNAPFGVVVVNNDTGEIIWRDHDRVKEYMDPTAHGEVNAVRGLCKKLCKLSLKNTTFYTTSEPCATCLSSMVKAKVPFSYYGAETEEDASLPIKSKKLATYATKHPISVTGGVLGDKCLAQRKRLL